MLIFRWILFVLGMTTVDIFHDLLHPLLRFKINLLCNDLIFSSGDIKRESVIPSCSVID